jgi:hypothetical protein
MRTLVCCVLAVVAVLHAAGCGDGGPTAPGPSATGPTPVPQPESFQPVRIVSGVDRRPVAGADVLLEGSGHVSNVQGEVIPGSGERAGAGAEIDVDAPGFLPRRTRVPGDRLVTLWPVASDAEAGAVRQMVYGGPRGDVLVPTTSNWISLSFGIALDDPMGPDIKGAWGAEAAAFGSPFGLRYEEGLARPYETEHEMAVRFAETGGCATIPAWGFCLESASGNDMSFRVLPANARDPQTIRRVLASWFLGPNPLPGFMNPDAPAADLSPLEAQTIRMILQRPLPNRWPDSDR